MTIDKTQVARQFSRAANTYDSVAEVQQKMASQLIDSIPADAQGTLVDLGCGTGTALAQIARKHPHLNLVGVDLAPAMLEVARRTAPTADFILGDIEQTNLAAGCANIVFSSAALQWCDANLAVQEIHRLLIPGGRLLASTFGPGTLQQIRQAWTDICPAVNRVHELAQDDELMAVLKACNFQEIEMSQKRHDVHFPSVDAMLSSVRKLGATYADSDRKQHSVSKSNYRRLLERLSELAGDQPTLTYQCIKFSATKSG
jgi:malonyl-CoA O-methyltransferase